MKEEQVFDTLEQYRKALIAITIAHITKNLDKDMTKCRAEIIAAFSEQLGLILVGLDLESKTDIMEGLSEIAIEASLKHEDNIKKLQQTGEHIQKDQADLDS